MSHVTKSVSLSVSPINQISLALAVTGDGNIDELGDGDDGNLGVQDDAEIILLGIGSAIRPFGSWINLEGTYSEAMLISGASKQISSAILYYFSIFIIY